MKKLPRPHSKEYAIRVQSLVRNLRPRLKLPDKIRLCFMDDLGIVKSVGWAGFKESQSGHHRGSVYVLATHSAYTRQGAGQAAYEGIVDDLIGLAQESSAFESLTISTLVHPDNIECKSLLRRNQWTYSELDVDGLHEEWVLVIGVDQ